MELNDRAEIDTSQIEDRRGSGGGGGGGGMGIPLPGGGGGRGGVLSLIIGVVVLLLGGGTYGATQLGGGGEETADNTTIEQQCSTQNAERLEQLDCRNALYVNSIQDWWADALPQNFDKTYQPADTVFFSQRVSTGCGAADSGVGPFYCPADRKVFIDLTFYQQLAQQLGAPGEFAQPYVLAHEYGHHVQTLLGTEAQMRRQQQRDPGGANELSVRLELQADCYAGAWAKNAVSTDTKSGVQIFTSITDADIQEGLQTAGKIGDDSLQQRGGGTVNPAEFTHGTSAQRQKWFRTGYDGGDPKRCNTFEVANL
ncbi:KPN_02809 family neutral zinc metallopeptidase [Spirilliplanes yamanashiensis]|uniref:Membrane protein n=1 Tax=Spirilliplanes yamanashiensis TaxID=42233 RepID=A0A8J4DJQ3_9ACTN|nr:neutral zinc metallopeptidase [Spirilliplanes yamanashiensis]MDP9817106.1 putative metalloprotease [Spirilliplanes yamanashiensis]GIJ03240.1 membrane protein [Spirilliplanes yamanashiensis]